MRVVGIFRELTRERPPHLPSIIDAKGMLAPEKIDAVIVFLRKGIPVFDVTEATPDPFDPQKFVMGGPSLVSDGYWVWREDLSYYVENYHVGLPEEFMAHVNRANCSEINESAVVARWEEALAAYEIAERGLTQKTL